MLSIDDTIAAVASAAGGAARGIVRLSGPAVIDIVAQRFRDAYQTIDWRQFTQPMAISGSVACKLHTDAAANQRTWELPADLFLWPTARSYTRQPLAELHTIGSPPLLQAMLEEFCQCGARLAQPGEFTLRAFLAGRIDLTQAEAVLGVVEATDRRQLSTALAQLAGGLSRPLEQLRSDLLNLLADLEAGLDFVEDDIRFVSSGELNSRVANAATQLEQIGRQLTGRNAGNALPRVALAGWPNVGKSSLFNALVGSEAALVSPLAGTTRDYLTAAIHADGMQVELVDTAGLAADGRTGKTEDIAAQEAAAGQHQQADLKLLCLDATRPVNEWEQNALRESSGDVKTLVVFTKCDMQPEACAATSALSAASVSAARGVPTSSRSGLGLKSLRTAIRTALAAQPSETSIVVAGTAVRVRESVRLAGEALSRAKQLKAAPEDEPLAEELMAAEIRSALVELGKVVGAVYTDDLLDRIFSRFCIGK